MPVDGHASVVTGALLPRATWKYVRGALLATDDGDETVVDNVPFDVLMTLSDWPESLAS